MTKERLIEELQRLAANAKHDIEAAHITADGLLLAFVNDPEITSAYDAIKKFYA